MAQAPTHLASVEKQAQPEIIDAGIVRDSYQVVHTLRSANRTPRDQMNPGNITVAWDAPCRGQQR